MGLRAGLFIVLLCTCMAANAGDCELRLLGGSSKKSVPYESFEQVAHRAAQRVFPDLGPNDVVIGVSREGHAYYYTNGWRFDGKLGFNYDSLRISRAEILSEGIVVRVKNVPEAIIVRLRDKLARGLVPRASTCAREVKFSLQNTGLRFGAGSHFLPASFLLSLWEDGVTTSTGEVLEIETKAIGFTTLEEAMSSIKWSNGLELAIPASGVSVVVAIAATAMYCAH